MMKPASVALINFLNGNSTFLMADLYTVWLRTGEVFRWNTGDTDLSFGGNTFTASTDQGSSQPLIKRGSIRSVVGLEVDTLDLTLMAGQSVRLFGIPLPLAIHNGALDGARVRVERVFMPAWGDTSLGSVPLFEGNVAEADPSSCQVAVTVKSEKERLNVSMPRTLFMPACSNIFGDQACGKSLAAVTVTGTVGANPSAFSFPTGRAEADGYFVLGVLTMTSGAAAGAKRAVKTFAGGVVTLALPLPVVPSPGDTFTVYPGCDRQMATCRDKHNNLPNFRGCPFVPRPEAVR